MFYLILYLPISSIMQCRLLWSPTRPLNTLELRIRVCARPILNVKLRHRHTRPGGTTNAQVPLQHVSRPSHPQIHTLNLGWALLTLSLERAFRLGLPNLVDEIDSIRYDT